MAAVSASENKQLLSDLKSALYAAKICSYAQGFMLLREAAKEYKWDLNYGDIALMWRGGCIIGTVYQIEGKAHVEMVWLFFEFRTSTKDTHS